MLKSISPQQFSPSAPQKSVRHFPLPKNKLPFSQWQNLRPQKTRELPFPQDVRERMGNTFHTDFSAMRFYESPTPASLRAKALTSGNESYFAPGSFSPHSESGLRLIGHELSHAAAQSRGVGSGKGGLLYAAGLEARAEQEGREAARGAVSPCSFSFSRVRPLSNAPYQGYFTLLPEDYILISDGTKAPFATHVYHTVPAQDDPTVADFNQEFSKPDLPVYPGYREAVPGSALEEPSAQSELLPLFRHLKGIDNPFDPANQNNAVTAFSRLSAHRKISDLYSNRLGSHHPSFQQSISRDPLTSADRYAAIGVHRYTGKVALYVADDASFAVNAQTPEPKEAYVREDKINEVCTARKDSCIRLVSFDNFFKISLPSGVVILKMVRPCFNGNFRFAPTTVCSEFAALVAPGSDTNNADNENTMTKKDLYLRINLKQAASKLSDILADLTDPVIEGFQQTYAPNKDKKKLLFKILSPVFKKFKSALKKTKSSQDIRFCINDFDRAVRTCLNPLIPALPPVEGFTVSSELIDSGPVEYAVPSQAGVPQTLAQLRDPARSAMKREFYKAQILAVNSLLDEAFGWPGGSHTPEEDVRRVTDQTINQQERSSARGINAFAAPHTGQAYRITPVVGQGWEYHFAGVVAKSDGDRLTLENYNKKAELSDLRFAFIKEQIQLIYSTPPDELNARLTALAAKQDEKSRFYAMELLKTWYFSIQGLNRVGQSFHEKQDVTGAYGFFSTTTVK